MILASIKFASTAAMWAEDEKKRAAAIAAMNNNQPTNNNNHPGSNGSSGGNDFLNSGPMNDRAREELGQGEILVRQGDNPAFVSLG